MELDYDSDMQKLALNTIYHEFTSFDLKSLTGAHWMDIGFLGKDPKAELRSLGLLGVLFLLYFVEDLDLSRQMYRLRHQNHIF